MCNAFGHRAKRLKTFHRQSPVPDRQKFWSGPIFLPLWVAGKNPTQSYCQSTVRLSQMPKADDNDCRLEWPGGFRTPQVRVFEVYRYENQNACPTRLNLTRCVGSQANYAGPIREAQELAIKSD